MIRPDYWSFNSIYRRISHKPPKALFSKDQEVYVNFLEPKGKIILDIGAYEGDSASTFLNAGAKLVICIEKKFEYAKYITDSRCMVFQEEFNPKRHLFQFNWDVAKLDIEGYEALLLPYLDSISKPIILEVHSPYLAESFRAKGFKDLTVPYGNDMLEVHLMGRKPNQ